MKLSWRSNVRIVQRDEVTEVLLDDHEQIRWISTCTGFENVEQTVFRIVQEALANIARHSDADKAEIELVYTLRNRTA